MPSIAPTIKPIIRGEERLDLAGERRSPERSAFNLDQREALLFERKGTTEKTAPKTPKLWHRKTFFLDENAGA